MGAIIELRHEYALESVVVMIKLFKPGRSKNYYAWYKKDGKQDQFSCHTANEREAYRYAIKEVERRLKEAQQPRIKSPLLSEFAADYLNLIKEQYSPRSVATIRDSFRQFQKRVKDKPISKITIEECEKFIYTSQPSKATAKKHYVQLRAAFQAALRWKKLHQNPFDGFNKPYVPEVAQDYLTPTEFQKFYDYLPADTYAERRFKRISLLAFETGAREGELLNLRKQQIDFARFAIQIINTPTFKTKTGKVRSTPLSDKAIEALKEQLAENYSHNLESIRESIYVFPNEKGEPLSIYTISETFRENRKVIFPDRIKLKFHCLRHSYATDMMLKGVASQQVQKSMGHSTIALTEKYAHLERIDYSELRSVLNQRKSYERPASNSLDNQEATITNEALTP